MCYFHKEYIEAVVVDTMHKFNLCPMHKYKKNIWKEIHNSDDNLCAFCEKKCELKWGWEKILQIFFYYFFLFICNENEKNLLPWHELSDEVTVRFVTCSVNLTSKDYAEQRGNFSFFLFAMQFIFIMSIFLCWYTRMTL